jgi:clan AA aspartic protease (TIGR02281 family)
MSDGYGSSGGQMLRRAFLWTVGAGVAAYVVPKYFDRLGFSSILGPDTSDSAPPIQLPPKQHPGATRNAAPADDDIASAPATERFRSVGGNSYVVMASVNGNLIRFVVDSGATDVVLAPADAQKIGVNLDALNWNIKSQTANGVSLNAAIEIAEIRIGSITKFSIPALVMRTPGAPSLLGMTFLNRLKSWQISNGVLTLAG